MRYYKVLGEKWKVCLFDLDSTMGGTLAYPIRIFINDPNEEITQVFHEPVSALVKVPAMRDLFLTRFGEILYEKFQFKDLDAKIDEWAEMVGPLISAQHERWNTGDIENWNESVATLRKYCKERPPKVVEHISATFSLSEDEVQRYFGAFLATVE